MARLRLLFGLPSRAAAAGGLVGALARGARGEIRTSPPARPRGGAAAPELLGDLLAGSFEPAPSSPGEPPAFIGIGRTLRVRVDAGGATLSAGAARVRLAFPRGAPAERVLPTAPLPGRSRHYPGRDGKRWRRDVPRFAGVRPGDAARGVSTLFRFRGSDPEYEFTVAPGADVAAIEVAVEGARELRVDDRGDLLAVVPDGVFRHGRPRAFEEGPDGPREIPAGFRLLGGNRYGFSVGPRDPGRVLRIDPVLTFSSPLGGGDSDSASAIAFAPDGTLWIGGQTESTDFPAGDGREPKYSDAVVVHFDPASRTVLSTTWLGGTYHEGVTALAVDPAGGVFAAGTTGSEDFPATGGPRTVYGGGEDAFLVRLDPAGGALSWSTFLGGWDSEGPTISLALTAEGDPVVAGTTESPDFPLRGAFRETLGGGSDGFVSCVRADGSDFLFSTYLGGASYDSVSPLTIAPDGGILVAGTTWSADFSGPRLFALTPGSGWEGFLAELDPAGGTLRRLVLLGRCNPTSLAFEPAGSLLLAGSTTDPSFPLPSAPHGPPESYAGDALLARIDRGLEQVLAGTLYGGAGSETRSLVASAPDGTVWLAGSTTSTDLPGALPPSRLPFPDATETAYLAHVDLGGPGVLSARHVGTGYTTPWALVVAPDGAPWMVGRTSAAEFPLVDPIQAGPRGGWSDMFLARFVAGESAAPPVAPGAVGAWALSGNEVLVTWSDDSSDEAGFAIYRYADESNTGYSLPIERVGAVPPGTTAFVDGTALPDRRYLYAVQALDEAGGASSSGAAEVVTPSTLIVDIRGGSLWYTSPSTWGSLRGRLILRDRTDARPLDLVKDGLTLECSIRGGFPGSRVGLPEVSPQWRISRHRILWRSNPYSWATTIRFHPRTGVFRFRNIHLGGDLADGVVCRFRLTSGVHSGEARIVLGNGGRITGAGEGE